MKQIIIVALTVIFFWACGDKEKPKVIYNDDRNIETPELKEDSTLMEIADMPIHIDSTEYLIHPIGDYQMYGSRDKIYFSSSSYGSENFSISNFNDYEITGNLHNLKFQQIDSDNSSTLTTKRIQINSITFLRDIFNNTKKQVLVYRVLDKDTNRDGQLDENDISAFYISNIDGTDFMKLTSDFQELIDWKVLAIKNRLYFRSIEDTNKNGEFDKGDKISYQYLDFNLEKRKVVEYQPLWRREVTTNIKHSYIRLSKRHLAREDRRIFGFGF